MDGITKITMKKLTGMMMAAKMPKALIGVMSEATLARKAAAVVVDVTEIALNALLKA